MVDDDRIETNSILIDCHLIIVNLIIGLSLLLCKQILQQYVVSELLLRQFNVFMLSY